MPIQDPIGTQFVLLALRLDRHIPGFVDAFFGPPGLKARVQNEAPTPLITLEVEADRLCENIEAASIEADRRDYLTKQARAMRTAVQLRLGREMSYRDEVRALFDIRPEKTPEAEFDRALREVDTILPGKGDLARRQIAWRRRFQLPNAAVLPVMSTALREVRLRTRRILVLPRGEGVQLELVTGQPWSGYNWYLGRGRSRVQINTDLPPMANDALDLMAHEGYPGHHTEAMLKERLLYQQAGRLEHSVAILLAPECLVGEGIACVAKEVIFPDPAEEIAFLRDVLYPLAGIDVDVDLDQRLRKAREPLSGLAGNVGFLLHEEGRPESEVVDYVRHYGLKTIREARRTVAFVKNRLYRGYVFNYHYGRLMLKQAFAKHGMLDVFRWVMTSPVTPSALAASPSNPAASPCA